MSVEALNWARQMGAVARLQPAPLLLLWMIADRANKEWSCWDGMNTLAWESNQSERSVRRHLKLLEQQGIITRRVRRGQYRSRRTGVLYTDVRLTDYITLERDVLATFQETTGPVNLEDPLESADGYIGGRASAEDVVEDTEVHRIGSTSEEGPGALPDNVSGRSGAQETPLPDNLAGRGGLPDKSGRPYRTNRASSPTVSTLESHARNKNPHMNPQSSSMRSSATTDAKMPSAGAEADDDEDKNFSRTGPANSASFGTHAGVDLDRVAGLLTGQCPVTVTRDRLVWLTDAIVARSRRGRPGNPGQYVVRALEMSGHEWTAVMAEEFSDRSGGHGTAGDRKCPIQHHADSGWTARTCPGCRKQLDFPKVLDRVTYAALDADVRSLVDRDQTVTVVDMTGPSVRSRDRSDRTDDRDAG